MAGSEALWIALVVSGCCDSIGHLRDATDSGRLFDVLWIADGVLDLPRLCDYLGSAIDSIGHLGDAIDSRRLLEVLYMADSWFGDAIDSQRLSLRCYS